MSALECLLYFCEECWAGKSMCLRAGVVAHVWENPLCRKTWVIIQVPPRNRSGDTAHKPGRWRQEDQRFKVTRVEFKANLGYPIITCLNSVDNKGQRLQTISSLQSIWHHSTDNTPKSPSYLISEWVSLLPRISQSWPQATPVLETRPSLGRGDSFPFPYFLKILLGVGLGNRFSFASAHCSLGRASHSWPGRVQLVSTRSWQGL